MKTNGDYSKKCEKITKNMKKMIWTTTLFLITTTITSCMDPTPLYAELGPVQTKYNAKQTPTEDAWFLTQKTNTEPAPKSAKNQTTALTVQQDTQEDTELAEHTEPAAQKSHKQSTKAPKSPPSSPTNSNTPQTEHKVNINTATKEQLMLLPGVGPKMAEKIILARQRRPFAKTSHLQRIKGIGPKKWKKMAKYIAIDGETSLTK